MSIPIQEQANYETFRECLSAQLISSLTVSKAQKKTRRARKLKSKDADEKAVTERGGGDGLEDGEGSDAEELAEFIDYLAVEIFTSLPGDFRTLSYSAIQNDPDLSAKYSAPLAPETLSDLFNALPPSVSDSLATYTLDSPNNTSANHPGSTAPAEALSPVLNPVLNAYISALTAAPPVPSSTRAAAEHCELCLRTWIPLTYHHLIPRSTHAKALKRGWVAGEWELQNVAWLCRACHSFVHSVASNEELAREYASVEALLGREDVRAFVGWVGRVRWKSR